LIVEDDQNDAFIFQRACAKEHLHPTLRFVSDVQQSFDYLLAKPPYTNRTDHPFPDLLIVDLKFPAADGFLLLEWIRASPTFHDLHTIVLTDSSDAGDKTRALRLGALDYYVKPRDADRFQKVVKEICRKWLG